MSKVLVIRTRQQVKILRKSLERSAIREHQQWHLQRAEGMRAEAEKIQAYIDLNALDMPEQDVRNAQQMIVELKTQAISEENGKCMEMAPHA